MTDLIKRLRLLGMQIDNQLILDAADEIKWMQEDVERYHWLRRRAVMMDCADEVSITLTLFKDEGPTGEFLDDQVDHMKRESQRSGDGS
jgi:hypothetical protein